VPEFLTPTLLVDIAIAWMLVEALVVGAGYLRRGQPALARWSFANAAAGLMLLLAARVALSGLGLGPLALCLAGALAAHLIELAWRGALGKPGS
jgi:hypothetical protein